MSGGGSIESQGDFPRENKLTIAVIGGGRVDVRSLDVAEVTATVDGAGEISEMAKDALTAVIDSGGHIKYWGNPRLNEFVDGGEV